MTANTDPAVQTPRPGAALPGVPAVPRQPAVGSPWAAVIAIWLAIAGLAIWAPDMVSGSQHEHLPLGLITVWLWGAAATAYALMTPRRESLRGWSAAVIALWGATLLVGLLAPELVTGSDPTRIPLAVVVAPPVAALLTGMLSLHEAGRQVNDRP